MSQPEPRDVRLVLDTSAVVGFIRGATAPGEMIAMLDEEHGAVLLPLPCLVEAAANVLDAAPWLGILTRSPAVIVATNNPDDYPALAAVRKRVGTYEIAAGGMDGTQLRRRRAQPLPEAVRAARPRSRPAVRRLTGRRYSRLILRPPHPASRFTAGR